MNQIIVNLQVKKTEVETKKANLQALAGDFPECAKCIQMADAEIAQLDAAIAKETIIAEKLADAEFITAMNKIKTVPKYSSMSFRNISKEKVLELEAVYDNGALTPDQKLMLYDVKLSH